MVSKEGGFGVSDKCHPFFWGIWVHQKFHDPPTQKKSFLHKWKIMVLMGVKLYPPPLTINPI